MARIALFVVLAVFGTAIHGYEFTSPKNYVSRMVQKASSIVGQNEEEMASLITYPVTKRQMAPPYLPVVDKQSPLVTKQKVSTFSTESFTTEQSTSSPSPDSSRYHCFRDGLYPNPLDCTTYVQCISGQAYLKTCASGLHYNRRTQKCDQPCYARCDPRACRRTSSATPVPDVVCLKDGLQRNPRDCTTYIQCSNGQSYVMRCFSGLHFNEQTQRCEAPCYARCDTSIAQECGWTDVQDTTTDAYEDSNVCKRPPQKGPCKFYQVRYYFDSKEGTCKKFVFGGCESNGNNFRTEKECSEQCLTWTDYYKSSKSPIPAEFSCIEDGLFLNPENCGTYIECYDGLATLLQCPENLHFSQQNQRCEAACDAHCDASIAEDCGWDLWQYNILKEDFTCDKDGLFQNPEDCSTYTQCSSGQGYVMPCPKGLHFSEETQSCETPCDARCDPSLADKCSRTIHRGGALVKQPLFDFACVRNGLFENHGDCRTFVQCTRGSAYLISCPYGQHFDPRTKKCEEPCTAQCDPSISNQCGEDENVKRRQRPIRWNSIKQSSDFTCYEDGLYPDPQDCSSYVQCSNGRSRTLRCPEDLHYSQGTRRCESPCDARCDQSLADVCGWQNKVYATRQPEYDVACSNDGKFQNPSNCSTYIQCSEKRAHVVSCPEGLHFSAETETCEIPCQAQCDKSLADFCGFDEMPSFASQTYNPMPSTPDPSLILEDFDCESDGFYDSGECTTYVQCLNDVAYLFSCPENQHFSQEAERCLAPRDAHCTQNNESHNMF